MKKYVILGLYMLCFTTMFAEGYKPSAKCVEFIKRFEKCSLTAYWDSNGYSIGYGHHTNVKRNDKITKATAIKYLNEDIKESAKYVNYLLDKLPYKYKFSQNFIDGFTSFVYNAGVGNAENSTFYKRLSKCRVRKGVMNKNDWEFALSAIKKDCVSAKGHIERRKHEYKLMRNK